MLDGVVKMVAQLVGAEQRDAPLLIGEALAVQQGQIEEQPLLRRPGAIETLGKCQDRDPERYGVGREGTTDAAIELARRLV